MRSSVSVALLVSTLAACAVPHDDTPSATPADTGKPNPASDAADPTSHPPAEIDGYPVGPFGMKVGNTFPNLALDGYRDGKGEWTTLTLKDYYDPDASHGIRGLYLTISAPWCAGCVAEAKVLPGEYASKYRELGAKLLTALAQDASSKPATRNTVDTWVSTYKINFDIVADPTLSTAPKDASGGGSIALPYNYVIDPRTMKIVHINSGPFFTGGAIPGLDELLAKNAAK